MLLELGVIGDIADVVPLYVAVVLLLIGVCMILEQVVGFAGVIVDIVLLLLILVLLGIV